MLLDILTFSIIISSMQITLTRLFQEQAKESGQLKTYSIIINASIDNK
jgi:hypothetical protein